MLLNSLKNHQVRPYFWRSRRESLGAVEFHYLDLGVLRDAVAEEKVTDEALEELLYGTSVERRYTGWTREVLLFVATQCGFSIESGADTASPSGDGPGPWVPRNLRLESAPWGPAQILAARAHLGEQRLWAWRKSLRLSTVSAKARLKAALRPADLSGQGLRLNLGAGDENHVGYIKVDRAGCQHVYDDIVTLTRIRDGSVAEIYTNHVLEHVPEPLLTPMLTRWREVLAPGGRVLARMPDARQAVLSLGAPWVEATAEELTRHGLPDFLAKEATREGVLDDQAAIQLIYGWSGSTPFSWDDVNQHKTLWTPALARKRFEAAGFTVEYAENLGTLNTLVVAQA